MCPTNLEKELTALQHLFPDYAQMRAHIVTVINNRTRGPAPMMMGNLNDEASNWDASSDESTESEDGELYRLEIRTAKRFSPNPGTSRAKATLKVEGRVEPTIIFPLWTHRSHQSGLQSQDPHLWRTPEICTQRKRCWKLLGREARNITKCSIGNHRCGVL